MMKRRVPYARVVCDRRELDYVQEVLASGWLTTASKALEFERRFADFVQTPYACAVNSCTAALHLALDALGVRKEDKVFVPTWTFTATAEVVRYLGADPVFLDVDYRTGLLTTAILEEAIQKYPDVKVLMVVHFGGQAAHMLPTAEGSGILAMCQKHGIRIVEDAAHAFPARLGGRMVGSLGDVTCFSFYANKTITTGEGGMVTTANEQLHERIKIMRLHGIDRDVWKRFTSDKPAWEYDVLAPGYKYNMPDINAAVGLAQLERAEEFRKDRQRCALHYLSALADVRGLDLPQLTVGAEDHAWHLFPVILTPEAGVARNEFIEQLAERGIGASVHYKPIHRMAYYRDRYHLRPDDYPNAERIWRGCLSLPIYASLSSEDLEYVSDTLRDLLAAPKQLPARRPADVEAKPVNPGTGSVKVRSARIHLSIPHMDGREKRYVDEAFVSNWLSTVGPNVRALEGEFEKLVGFPALVVSSGTAAIHLGLRILGVGPGDEVFAPTLTFVASVNPILYLGGVPVFFDSDRTTWNLDPSLLADVLRQRAAQNRLPKALVMVHLFGQSADVDPILEVCRDYGVPVLEDAAESLGATYKGRRVGTFGDVSVFSLNGNKVVTATSGGVLCSPKREWVEAARHWAHQSLDPNPEHNYLHSQLGYNYRLSNVLAGIGRGQLELLDERVRQRRAIAFRYRDAFARIPGIELMPQAAYGFHTNWLSCFLVDESQFGCSAGELIEHLEAANVESRPVWRPMHTQPLYRQCECIGGAVAEDLNRRGICLPSSSSLSAEDQQFVIDRILDAHERAHA